MLLVNQPYRQQTNFCPNNDISFESVCVSKQEREREKFKFLVKGHFVIEFCVNFDERKKILTSDNSGNMTLFILLALILPLAIRFGFCDVGDAMFVILLPDDILSVLPLCGISLTVSRRKLDFRPAASLTNTGDLVITGCSIYKLIE